MSCSSDGHTFEWRRGYWAVGQWLSRFHLSRRTKKLSVSSQSFLFDGEVWLWWLWWMWWMWWLWWLCGCQWCPIPRSSLDLRSMIRKWWDLFNFTFLCAFCLCHNPMYLHINAVFAEGDFGIGPVNTSESVEPFNHSLVSSLSLVTRQVGALLGALWVEVTLALELLQCQSGA